MAPAPAKNGNGWAIQVLKWILGAALAYLIGVNTFLVQGHYRVERQGAANELAIKQISDVLSDRARAEIAAATAERDGLLVQVRELQRQQGQERETRESPGRPLPSQE